MQERQFNCITDLLDLPCQAADIAVGDVWHLLENKVLHLRLGNALKGIARLGVDQ